MAARRTLLAVNCGLRVSARDPKSHWGGGSIGDGAHFLMFTPLDKSVNGKTPKTLVHVRQASRPERAVDGDCWPQGDRDV